MLAIWVGALLVLGGLLTLAAPPVWRRHVKRREPGSDIDPERGWPGMALIAMGVILLLAGTFA
jgi:uncharacterized protein YjeT (DUF2065 family)